MKGEKVHLRAPEPDDLQLLYLWENDTENWSVSNTTAPFSKHILQQFIETSSCNLYDNRQMRLMICENSTGRPVGCIDIFDFDPQQLRAGIGILIATDYRQRGYALEALLLTKEYLFRVLHLHQIFCDIMVANEGSIALFEKAGFTHCGCKRDWMRTPDGWSDVLTLQSINENNQ